MASKFRHFIWTLAIIVFACVEPYEPPVRNEDVGFLVVNGYVNTSTQVATIRLSRAIALTGINDFPAVTNATAAIEDKLGNTINLQQSSDGIYTTTSPLLKTGGEYRLHIRMSDAKEYSSQWIIANSVPPIDSLTWDSDEGGITIRVNTHDFSNQTRYFRWDLVESWEYYSSFTSNFEFVNGKIQLRKFDERVNRCYRTTLSDKVNTTNTLDLSENKLSGHPLLFIERFSEKIEHTYSVEVIQYGLSSEGYNYWEKLRVTAENVGGLFDPQPARLKGNIFSVNESNEAVIGFFDAGEVSTSRMFVKNRELPTSFQRYPLNGECEEYFTDPQAALQLNGAQLITSAVYDGIVLLGYKYTTHACADCRYQGGSLQKPQFWPE